MVIFQRKLFRSPVPMWCDVDHSGEFRFPPPKVLTLLQSSFLKANFFISGDNDGSTSISTTAGGIAVSGRNDRLQPGIRT
jgi:hypothetical protein